MAAYLPGEGVVLAQVARKTKSKRPRGCDAGATSLSSQVVEGGGELSGKKNQPQLREDIAIAVDFGQAVGRSRNAV